ncbi:hypothetical protein [Pseudidiomarina sp.]|uniref:hypothetical protein n=1 Tax=Pseudidiomarina sp. TaxID=2081707 RepID=UPI003A970588
MRTYKWIGKALAEFLINILVSTIPFSMAVLTLMMSSKLNMDFNEAIRKIGSNGELVVYSATLMAPLIYAIIKDPPVRFKGAFAVIGLLLILSGAGVYVIGMLDGFSDRIMTFSFYCFCSSVLVFLMIIILQHEVDSRNNAPKIRSDAVADSLAEYKKHRGSSR